MTTRIPVRSLSSLISLMPSKIWRTKKGQGPNIKGRTKEQNSRKQLTTMYDLKIIFHLIFYKFRNLLHQSWFVSLVRDLIIHKAYITYNECTLMQTRHEDEDRQYLPYDDCTSICFRIKRFYFSFSSDHNTSSPSAVCL